MKNKIHTNFGLCRFILLLCVSCFNLVTLAWEIKKNSAALLENVQKSVVSIKVQMIKVPYILDNTMLGTGVGTGFVIDKEAGLILTNKHISDSSRIEHLEVSFFNGKEIKAELLYSDPWHDFALIAVDKKEIPDVVRAIPLSTKGAKMGQSVFMVGSNEGQSFSLQTGTISSIYQNFGFFPNQSIRISLNSRGGSSGSPVCDESGAAIAIQCGGNDTFAHALPIEYIQSALPAVKNNSIPKRRDIGAMLDYYSLDRAVRFFNFPKELVNEYTKAFPDARNNALIIESIFSDSPANESLKIGDIIWAVEGKTIGPNLHQLQKIFNENEKVKLSVYRNGKIENIEVTTYDLESARLKEMISFGGAMFFKADDLTRVLVDAKLGELLIGYAQPGSSFESNIPGLPWGRAGRLVLLRALKLNGKELDSLNTLAQLIPSLITKKDLLLEYKNYLIEQTYNDSLQTSRRNALSDVRYSGYDDVPTYFKYNDKTHRWNSSLIEANSLLSKLQ